MESTEYRLRDDLEKEWNALRKVELGMPEPSPETDRTILAYAAARQEAIRNRKLLFRRVTALAAVFTLCMGITFAMIGRQHSETKITGRYGMEFDTLNSDLCMLSEQLQDASDSMDSSAALELAAQNRMEL